VLLLSPPHRPQDKGGVLKGNAPDPMELQGLDPQYVAPMPADDAGGAPGASGASGGGRSSGRSKARPGREWEYTADGKLISRDLEGRREVIDLRASGAAADRSTPWRAARGLASAPRSDASGGSGRSGGSRRRSRKARDWYSTAFLAAVTAAYVGTLLLSLAKSGWKLAPVAVNPWMGAGPEGLVGAGAAALPLMEGPSKQWWRLGSALFLPAGIVHAAASIAALWAYGRYAQLALPRPQVSVAGVYLLPALLASLASANLDAAFLACGALAGPCALLGSVAADQVVNFRRKKLFNLREHWLVALILLANAALLVASGLLPMAGPWYPGVGALAGFLLSLILLSAKRVGRGRPGNVKWATTQIVCAVVLVGAATAAVVGCAMPRKLGESVPALGKASCVELGGKWACTPYGAPSPAAAATCSLAVAPGGGRLTCPGAGGTVAVQDATPQQAADPEAVAALCASYCGGGAAAAPAAAPGAAEPAAVEVAAPTPPADALPVTTIAPIVAAPLAGIPDIPAATPVVVPPQVPAAVEAAPAVPAAVEVAPLLTPFVAVPETQTVLQAAPAAVAAVPAAQSAAAQAAAASVAVASTLQPELQPAQQQVATAVVAPEVPLTIGRKLRAGRDQALLRHSASLPGAAAGGGGAGRKLRAGKQGRR
jgi:membrane associated rhomboid family serine protease